MFGDISTPRKDNITQSFSATLFVDHWTGFNAMVDNLFPIFIVSNRPVGKSLNWYFIACVFFQTFSLHDFLRLTLYKTCNFGTVGISPKEMGSL